MGILRRCGFTLLEIVITIVILGIVGVFTFAFFGDLTKTYKLMGTKRASHQEAAYVVERISRELRDAKTILSANPSLQFLSAHGTAQDSNRYVMFCLSGGNIYRVSNVDESFPACTTGRLLCSNVTNFNVAANGDIYTIDVTVSIGGQTQRYATSVSPKNYTQTGDCVFTGRDFGGCYEDKVY